MKNFVTVMNFVRGVDQRYQDRLYPTTEKQYKHCLNSGIKATFLLQHDAFTDYAYIDIFKKKNENIEVGVWLETCQSAVRKAGVAWRGREGYDFDWFSNVDTVVGYNRSEKTRIIETVMEDFKAVFGYYPKTVGAWVLDSFTVEMLGKYGVVCTCTCKDQWGTDGYTLFGGYYDHAYYPCKRNILCPAQSIDEQINVPVFRLLGCDPIYQYDCFVWSDHHVITLEPWKFENANGGGADPKWVDWYFNTLFKSGNGISFNYAQVGQENSFPWEGSKDGFLYQMKRVREMKDRGEIEDLTLSEAGEWFMRTYKESPPCTHTAMSDWMDKGNGSVWYYCKSYRVSVMLTRDSVYIRDLHIYDENYESIYNGDNICTEADCFFDVPTVMNGVAWSTKEKRAGIYFIDKETGKHLAPENVKYEEKDGGFVLEFESGGKTVKVIGLENRLAVDGKGVALRFEYASLTENETVRAEGNKVFFTKRTHPFALTLEGATVENATVYFDNNVSVTF